MCNFSATFINFSKQRMRDQGAEIVSWSKTDNPLLAQTCKEIIAAAQEAEK